MYKYLKLLRFKHYIKNILIAIPAFISGRMLFDGILYRVIFGIVVFNICASIVYVMNDLHDIDSDRKNPNKACRPIASGKVSILEGKLICLLLIFVLMLFAMLTHKWEMFAIPGLFIILNIAYTFFLKNVPLIDIFILMSGYLMRLYYGGYLAGTGISSWMYLTTMSGALFMGFGKRRGEYIHNLEVARESIKSYNISFLNIGLSVSLSTTIIFYALMCFDDNTTIAMRGIHLLWTVPVVIFLLLHYLLLCDDRECGGDPINIIVSDRLLLIMMLLMAIVLLIQIY